MLSRSLDQLDPAVYAARLAILNQTQFKICETESSRSNTISVVNSHLEIIQQRKAELAAIREQARERFLVGATGVQVSAMFSAAMDEFVVRLLEHELVELPEREQDALRQQTALVAVGGTGRGDLAPYSDVDLLFLYAPKVQSLNKELTSRVVRGYWDAGIELGHSVRTLSETLSLAKSEPQIATALVEARLLWGSEVLFEQLEKRFYQRVVRGRLRGFIQDCIAARGEERGQFGTTVHQLEPDVKRSAGGLRDVHLLRWIGSAHYQTREIDSLRLKGALSKEDARHLLTAYEFLERIRIDLHFAAKKSQDVLNRDEQLRIAEERGTEGIAGQRPVEKFMQTYFRHCRNIALIVDRFLIRHQPRSLQTRVWNFAMAHRAEGKYRVSYRGMDVLPRFREEVLGSLEEILRFYYCGMLNGLSPVPELIDALKLAVAKLPDQVSAESAELFLAILKRPVHLGKTLRSLYDVGVLERLIPDMAHARCLLQFNQYHSFTVDEHTLRAVEAATRFESAKGALGNAYRAIQRKEILHLALLLHDLGKGFEEDHSEVGKGIAERTALRLNLPEHRAQILIFLVHQHLKMAHLAFRRDISDPAILLPFSHSVGSPDTLRMFFVLTAADITAVGPGVWTDWKNELLSELYDGAMHVLSGRRLQYREEKRLEEIKKYLATAIVPLKSPGENRSVGDWINRQLDAFPPHYLNEYTPEQIASDLSAIQGLEPGEFFLDGEADPETGTVTYRLITHEQSAAGCFHRTVGVLTAKRLEILSADISTSMDGYVVDRYRVIDRDFDGAIPQNRIDDVTKSIRSALKREMEVKPLFRRNTRFRMDEPTDFSELPTRVVIDNNTSPRCTIIDVFAHDRPGLLYTATRTIFKLGLSVMLAKISTHLDQVVDVFYVTDANGEKIHDGERIRHIRDHLFQTIQDFEQDGYLQFQ